jgi:eukaryotic-like serine/threonine-protein kinase
MQAATLLADRFEIERLAGEGGMGTVYKGHDRVCGEPVAAKILRGRADGDKERIALRSSRALATVCRHALGIGPTKGELAELNPPGRP